MLCGCEIWYLTLWEERRREWDEHVTRKDAERLVKMPRDNKCRKTISKRSEKKMERLNPLLKYAESPTTKKKKRALKEECRLKVFENRIVRRIFRPKGRMGNGESSTKKNFIVCIIHII